MPLLASLASAAAGATLPHCSWDRPGMNPFTGDVAAAVDRYSDIPDPVRAKLKQRMAEQKYDDMVTIRRNAIEGAATYGADIREMHYGSKGNVCQTVSRAKWKPGHEERGLVYCESGYCILVPTVCRNVSRITRKALATAPVLKPGKDGNDVSATSDIEPAKDAKLKIDPPPATGVVGGGAPADRSFAQGADLAKDSLTPPGGLSIDPAAGESPTVLPPLTIQTPQLPPTTLPSVPEPSSLLFMLTGLMGVWAVARRRQG